MEVKEYVDSTSLGEVRQYLRDNWRQCPVRCPACTQGVNAQDRKLNSGMVKALLLMYKLTAASNFNYIHVRSEFKKHFNITAIDLEYNKLKYWGLIETRVGENPSGANKSGWWRITPLGVLFIKGEIKVLEFSVVFDAKRRGLVGNKIGIAHAIDNKFDYFELMGFPPLHELPGGTP